jgi:hypothetical protein
MSPVGKEFYHRGLAWIAYHRGAHNGNWPPTEPGKCVGWGCVKMLAGVHRISAWDVATDLIDYLERSENGDPQP